MAEVVLLRGAEDDALNLFIAIHERSTNRAEKFSRALDRALGELSVFPEIRSRYRGRYRRKLVIGFREYGVFYTVEGDRVMVQAILNLRQDPQQIRRRLSL